jgi:hypothetical protein
LTGVLGVVGFVGCLFGCFYFIEHAGRVRTMMLGSALNSMGMILLAGGISFSALFLCLSVVRN